MKLREKQRAKRKAEEAKEEKYQAVTGQRKPLTNYEEMREKFYYDMTRMELKDQKIREMNIDDGSVADYDDLTVTDEDFEEGERDRFQNFLKQRKEDKELGTKFYGDSQALREKQTYEDDYTAAEKEEIYHLSEEQERITDMLKREVPKSERLKQQQDFDKRKAETEALDERLVEIEQIETDNTRYDLESMRLDMKEVKNIYGKEQNIKDMFFRRREKQNTMRQ